VHFRASGADLSSSGFLQAGHTRRSSKSWAIMTGRLYPVLRLAETDQKSLEQDDSLQIRSLGRRIEGRFLCDLSALCGEDLRPV
jgi:hypothetical protein